MIVTDPNFKKLAETAILLLGYVFEDAYLVNKNTGEEICLGDLYGDPEQGIISDDDKWCLVTGSGLIVWRESDGISAIKEEDLWVIDARQFSPNEAELLTSSSIPTQKEVWRLNIDTLEKIHIRSI